MHKIYTKLFIFLLMLLLSCSVFAQQDRMQQLEKRLNDLSATIPGLGQKVQLMITGVSIQEYLGALARSNGLSISIDPKVSFPVYDSFNNVTAANILVLLAKKYNLDVTNVGQIIYITSYQDPAQFVKPPVKDIAIKYDKPTNTLSMSLQNDSLNSVAHKIIEVSGKNVIVPNSLQGKRVSAVMTGAIFETALDKLAYLNEIKVVKTSDNFYLFQPLEESEELYVNGDKNTAVRRAYRPSPPHPGGNTGLFTKTVNGQKLISADAVNAPVADLVSQASAELNKNYSIYSEIKGNITIHVNDISYEQLLTLLFKGTDNTFRLENGIYLIGDRRLEGLRTFKSVHLQNRSIDTIISMIPADWKKNIEIKEFREQNTLLLSGSSGQINEVENLINQLDVLVPVVLIEVTIIDFHKTRTVATGISAGISDSAKTGGTILPGVNFTASASSVNNFLNSLGKLTSINLGHVVPNFYVTLSALESNNNADIRSVPKLTALNGHSASLSIGSKRYYKNTTQNLIPFTTSSQSIFTNVYQEVNADLSVAIRPVVSGNDQVTLGIKVNISDFTSIPADGSPPPQSISKFETSLRVHSEDTIVLGGIERTENDEVTSGTPILSRIPILKWIFSNRTKTASKVVSVLFIKSTILR